MHNFISASLTILLGVVAMTTISDGMRTGGLSDEQEVIPTVQELVDKVRVQVESQVGGRYSKFTAVAYKYQIVTGYNYFVKVDVGGGNFIHVRIYLPLTHIGNGPSLTSYVTGQTADSEIEYF